MRSICSGVRALERQVGAKRPAQARQPVELRFDLDDLELRHRLGDALEPLLLRLRRLDLVRLLVQLELATFASLRS